MKTRFPFPAAWASATVFLASLFTAHAAAANDADLDPSFGVDGVALADVAHVQTLGGAGPAVQPDGKILICAGTVGDPDSHTGFVVARFDANGRLDASFGLDGFAMIDFGGDTNICTGIALQADGRIVVAGSIRSPTTQGADFAVARLEPDGTPDTGFGAGSGKVVVGFDLGGSNDDGARALAIQTDGRIVVAGAAYTAFSHTDFAVLRLLPDGTPDTTFNLTGMLTFHFDFPGSIRMDGAGAAALDAAGRIVLGGDDYHGDGLKLSNDFALARLLPDGRLDPDFGTDGRATVAFDAASNGNDRLDALTIQADGRIVAAGTADTSHGGDPNSDMAVARLLPNGMLDADFGMGGKMLVAFDLVPDATDYATALIQQPDGKLVLAGLAYGKGDPEPETFAATVRLNPDGTPDDGFGVFGRKTYDLGLYVPPRQWLYGVAMQGPRIVVAGATFRRVEDGPGIDNFVLRLGGDHIFVDGFE